MGATTATRIDFAPEAMEFLDAMVEAAGRKKGLPGSKWQEIVTNCNDPAAWLTAEGRVFYASDAAIADLVTGQTSHATTTPTFQLAVPAGSVAIPLLMRLFQAGTVAGGAITYHMEFDNAFRYSSSGTLETVLCANTAMDNKHNTCFFRSNPTATDAVGVRVDGGLIGQDVSPAEGAVNQIVWTPIAGFDLLNGGPDVNGAGASWNVYTSAASTGPTWNWMFKWAVIPYEWTVPA